MMDEFLQELFPYTDEEPSRFTVAMYYLLVGCYLERVEDPAVSISYYVHYIKTGKPNINSTMDKKSKKEEKT